MAPAFALPAEAQDLAVAGLVVALALVAFIAVLWLNRDAAKQSKAGAEQAAAGAAAAQGTVFAVENGKVVRRSSRARKPSEEALLATPAPKAEPKSPRAVRTPTAAAAAAKTPTAKASAPSAAPKTPTDRLVSPGRTRRAAAAPKTPIAATPDTAVRDAISPSRRRRRAV